MKVLCNCAKKNNCHNCSHSKPHEKGDICNRTCGLDNTPAGSDCNNYTYVISLRKDKLDILKEVSNEGRR